LNKTLIHIVIIGITKLRLITVSEALSLLNGVSIAINKNVIGYRKRTLLFLCVFCSKKIDKLQNVLNDSIQVLINRIVATYQVGTIQPLEVLLTSDNASNFITRLNYLKRAQAHDKQLVYEDKKKQIETLKTQLVAYTDKLDQEKKAKQDILTQTQGSEANYQQILAQTKAQLAAFSGFVTSQGGASLLSNQTSCNDWGCYYNQRDSQWGSTPLNGTGYTFASDGCLVTSMAMVYTHYGYKDITPQSINSNSSNFAGIPAALLRYSISANGVSSSRINVDIDSTLASGHPVIVGISYDGGNLADHFVVFVSGSGGNYMMNDPFTPNGQNISFRDRYPSVRIVESNKVVF
jgi:hypothetical protein